MISLMQILHTHYCCNCVYQVYHLAAIPICSIRNVYDHQGNQQNEEDYQLPRRLIQPEDKKRIAAAAQRSATSIELVTSTYNSQAFIDADIIRNHPAAKVVPSHR